MDDFKFRLQKVLDIKIKNESESKMKYSKAQNAKRQTENALKNLNENYDKYSKEIDFQDIAIRKITSNYLNSLAGTIDEKKVELNKKKNLVSEARTELLSKQIERKSLEKLKDYKYEIYKKEENKKEQITNDEFGLYSYLRRKVDMN